MWHLFLDGGNQILDPLPSPATHPLIRAETVEDGHTKIPCKLPCHLFPYVYERTDHAILAIICIEIRTHPFYGSIEKEIQQKSLDKIVKVMSQRDLIPSVVHRVRVENPPAKTRTKGARIGAWFQVFVYYLHYATVYTRVRNVFLLQSSFQCLAIKRRRSGMHCSGRKLESDGCLALQSSERIQQSPRILAPGQCHQDAVSFLDKAKVTYCTSDESCYVLEKTIFHFVSGRVAPCQHLSVPYRVRRNGCPASPWGERAGELRVPENEIETKASTPVLQAGTIPVVLMACSRSWLFATNKPMEISRGHSRLKKPSF